MKQYSLLLKYLFATPIFALLFSCADENLPAHTEESEQVTREIIAPDFQTILDSVGLGIDIDL